MTSFRFALCLLPLLAAAQAPGNPTSGALTVEIGGIKSSAGTVIVSLCPDRNAGFPGGCRGPAGRQAASKGLTTVTLPSVPAGEYALQAFHDENGNGRADIPPEGYAFGNDVGWPPSFDGARIVVKAPGSTARVKMSYPGAEAPPAQGSRGAAPGDGVQRIDLREQGLYGELYVPAGAAAHSLRPLLLLGGSEGGLDIISQMAPGFARQGYATLALAYWNEQGLPQALENVPLEYFDRAVAWLAARPETAKARVGVVGWSRGSEAALLLGSRNPAIGAVVAVAPSGTVWQGLPGARPAWTAGGQGLPFVAPDAAAFRPGQPLRALFDNRLPEADRRVETAIPVERIGGDVLLISGGDDRVWPATPFAERIVARLQAAGFRHRIEHLSYPAAGHIVFVGDPAGPMAGFARSASPATMGGDASANASAWADSWPRTLAFLQQAGESP